MSYLPEVFIGEALSPEDWLTQLELEVQAKQRQGHDEAGQQRAA